MMLLMLSEVADDAPIKCLPGCSRQALSRLHITLAAWHCQGASLTDFDYCVRCRVLAGAAAGHQVSRGAVQQPGVPLGVLLSSPRPRRRPLTRS